MGKRNDSDGAQKRADKLGLGQAQLTIVLCGDEKKAKCASAAEMHRSWKHLRKRAKQLRKEQGIRITTIRSQCIDVCRFGPVAGVFPSGCWYGGCDEETLERILEAHLQGTPPPEQNQIAP
ncbi:(2Fe-2S) ferredoxin domain-containing protein [Candidatus Laterigemmans baculatus]|uniref:(2Fe-2S) ferredoxin domain-containing protein n=1 Tax=Candidatus Laterigemmans baculatus TaxID=2770505 RepID=UPI0013D95A62|nr:(2Fe-2S) ferredoxin domain-containing protein [Candidatus Laterigemmans baculatus]